MVAVRNALTIEELRRIALRYLPDFLGDYVERGAGNGDGVRRNVEAFGEYDLAARSLVKIRPADLGLELFGRHYSLPFGISAIGSLGAFRRHADEMLAETAVEADIPFMLSGCSMAPVERIARLAPDHTWCQLYAATDWTITEQMIARARDAGVNVLVLTMDFPVPNQSEVGSRSPISLATGADWKRWPTILSDLLRHPAWTFDLARAGDFPKMESWAPYAPPGSDAGAVTMFYAKHWPANLVWADVDRVRALWPGKLVLKGLGHPADVVRAVDAGVDAATVSNHGGNKLDALAPSLQLLTWIRREAEGRLPLFYDGGIRRGADVLKALALGADFCFAGRAPLYGVVAGGQDGARRALKILRSELSYALAMIGHAACRDVGPDALWGRSQGAPLIGDGPLAGHRGHDPGAKRVSHQEARDAHSEA